MIKVRRFLAVGAVFGLIAIVATSHLWSLPANDGDYKRLHDGGSAGPLVPPRAGGDLESQLAYCKFADSPVVTYRPSDGSMLFALEVKPKLDPVPTRPVDYYF